MSKPRKRRMFITESNDPTLNVGLPGYEAYDFDDNLESYLRAVRLRGRSDDTVIFYRQNVGHFDRILTEQGVSVRLDRVTKDVIERHFIEYSMDVLNHSINTIATRLRAIRAFFNWLVGEGVLSQSPMDGIVIPKQDTVVETYTRDQLNELFRQPDLETFVGYRDYAILTIFLDTGIRLRELCDITINDVRMSDNQILIKGKSGEFRLVPFGHTSKTVLNRYSKARGESAVPFLFITQDDGKLSRRGVQGRILKYGRMAAITNVRNSPHTFRHTFAKMAVRNGANIFDLQKILGHKTLEMVRVYVNLFSSEVAENHRKFSPVENLHIR